MGNEQVTGMCRVPGMDQNENVLNGLCLLQVGLYMDGLGKRLLMLIEFNL